MKSKVSYYSAFSSVSPFLLFLQYFLSIYKLLRLIFVFIFRVFFPIKSDRLKQIKVIFIGSGEKAPGEVKINFCLDPHSL